jgi:hypothetical protein
MQCSPPKQRSHTTNCANRNGLELAAKTLLERYGDEKI